MKICNDQLACAGFVETTYDGQEGIFYTKRQQAWDMPYVREHIIDNDEVLPETEVIVEVTPDQQVQMCIPDADYVEGPFAFESDEALALLEDAGLPLIRRGPASSIQVGNHPCHSRAAQN